MKVDTRPSVWGEVQWCYRGILPSQAKMSEGYFLMFLEANVETFLPKSKV